MLRTYRELARLETFEERFEYLSLQGSVGRDTFGFERYLNQGFYKSRQWMDVRHRVIARDHGNDLGIEGFAIHDRVIIHHMNPMTPEDLIDGNEDILNPEFLITTNHTTHNAIHYGNIRNLARQVVERSPGDTRLW
jgi:hypothetical protein